MDQEGHLVQRKLGTFLVLAYVNITSVLSKASVECDSYLWYLCECLALAEGLHPTEVVCLGHSAVWVTQVGGCMDVLTPAASPGCWLCAKIHISTTHLCEQIESLLQG